MNTLPVDTKLVVLAAMIEGNSIRSTERMAGVHRDAIMRRFTRLPNGFSKKLDNLKAAVALHFAHYNFVRVRQTMRVTPAMAARVTDHLWTLRELLEQSAHA